MSNSSLEVIQKRKFIELLVTLYNRWSDILDNKKIADHDKDKGKILNLRNVSCRNVSQILYSSHGLFFLCVAITAPDFR